MTLDEKREKSRCYQMNYRARMTDERKQLEREKARIAMQEFRANNHEHYKAYYLEWYRKHCDVLAKRKREWRKDKPDQYLATRRIYAENNREKLNEMGRKYRREHPGFSTKQVHLWKAKFPEKYYLANVNARAKRRRQGEGSWKLTSDELNGLLSAQHGSCFYCQTDLGEGFHLEHKHPLSKGGLHLLENLCLSCPRCNLRKHNKTEVEFKYYLDKER